MSKTITRTVLTIQNIRWHETNGTPLTCAKTGCNKELKEGDDITIRLSSTKSRYKRIHYHTECWEKMLL